MSFGEFNLLLDEVYSKKLTMAQKMGIFQKLDNQNRGGISIAQFLQATEIIKSFPDHVYTIYQPKIWILIKYYSRKFFKLDILVDTLTFQIITIIIPIINSVIIVVLLIGINENVDPWLERIDNYFVILYIAEAVIKILGLGLLPYFKDNWNKLDVFLIVATLTTDAAFNNFKFLRNAKNAKVSRIFSSLRLRNLLRATRSFRTFKVRPFNMSNRLAI